jgi:gliding motility-associated protein GldE
LDPEPYFNFISLSLLRPIEINTIIALAVLFILLSTSALISGAEVAFFALTPSELSNIRIKKTKKSKLIQRFLQKPKELLATILIANNFVNIGVIILASQITSQIFYFQELMWFKFVIQVVLITFLLLLFGEVLPKVYANNNAVSFAKFMSIPISVLEKIFKPINIILILSSKLINKSTKQESEEISVNDLSHALELTSHKDEDREEKKILEGIVKFGNTDVKQIMNSRTHITALDREASFDKVLKKVRESGFSRIPVYENSLDTIKGVLYIKDLLPFIGEKPFNDWTKLAREVFFVPENKKIDDLLKDFQEKKIHLAIVVDEYGGTSGLVTLEDVIEEIVGDINDEFDDDDIIYSKLDEHNYVFEGKTSLNDFYRILQIEGTDFEEAKGESDSLAGFILELTGNIPKKNEQISFNDFTFTIEGVNYKSVTRIKVAQRNNVDFKNEK